MTRRAPEHELAAAAEPSELPSELPEGLAREILYGAIALGRCPALRERALTPELLAAAE